FPIGSSSLLCRKRRFPCDQGFHGGFGLEKFALHGEIPPLACAATGASGIGSMCSMSSQRHVLDIWRCALTNAVHFSVGAGLNCRSTPVAGVVTGLPACAKGAIGMP